ncbi:MAG: sortase [Anaerolineaceae bacterium]|nr:sortase [Anaerolineaceae bacterium]
MALAALAARLIGLATLLLTAACQAAAVIRTPTAALPAPRARSESISVNAAETLPAATPTQEAVPDTLAALTHAHYGARRIEWISIEAINLLAPVVAVGWSGGENPSDPAVVEWDSPGASVGWALGSALPDDMKGNILLYGHNNIHSSVFRSLWQLKAGDAVILTTGAREWRYLVAEVEILPVLEQEADAAAYAEYLRPSQAPRLTLISCWPPASNTHRVFVVAYPQLR